MPFYDIGRAKTRLFIQEGWKVLSIAPTPLPWTTQVFAEHPPFLQSVTSAPHALGVQDLTQLPFADGEFDYAVLLSIVEKVDDPGTFCQEIQRVAKAGFIESSSAVREWLCPDDLNHWFVGGEGETLKLYPKPEDFEGYGKTFQDLVWRSQYQLPLRWDMDKNAYVLTIRYQWEGELNCVVEDLTPAIFRPL